MRSNQRHLTTRDALVLIAATALGLLGSVSIYNGPFYSGNSYLAFDIRYLRRWDSILSYLDHYSFVASPCLMAWTFALSVLALDQRRSPLKRIARQPGVVACWAVSLSLSIAVLLEAMSWLHRGAEFADFMDWGLPSAFRPAGCSVVSAWVIGAASRTLRLEPNWLDRLGRLFGVLWIIAMPLPAWLEW